MASVSREVWLREGLRVLGELGIDGLKIETVASRLSVTKGSFYHHFSGRTEYGEQLLAYWESENTVRISRLASDSDDPVERIRQLVKATSSLPHEPEVAVRAWALNDPLARDYQRRVDRARLAYLEEVHLLLTGDAGKARTGARLAYAVLVGSQQIVPAIHGRSLEALFGELLWGLYRCRLSSSGENAARQRGRRGQGKAKDRA